jgi:uncharacterized NAD(P)/FAD-binding protein YdhS
VPQEYDAVIVGGGLAGTTVAAELATCAPPGYRVLIAEPHEPGPGTAYAPSSERLFMNGTARAMSAVPGDKQHLVRWLRTESENALISRRLYGRYLAERFRQVLAQRPDFELAPMRVVDLQEDGTAFVVTGDAGTARRARSVVLAIGNFPPADAFLPQAVREHPGYVPDLWRSEPLLATILRREVGDALIVGTGLTGMDAISLLDEHGFRGTIHLLSRRGLLPCLENPFARALDPAAFELETQSPYRLLRSLRRAARRHMERGGDWRDVVETLRPITPAIWGGWSLRDRRRFLRHLQSYWAIHRYRVPPQTAAVYQRLALEGRIVRHRGRLAAATACGRGRIRAKIADPFGNLTSAVVSIVVNCTGPNGDYERTAHPLVRNMLRRGLLRPDPLRLGLDAGADLRVIGRNGTPHPRLFALGPTVRGVWYETTAVPETREQAARIARALAGDVGAKRLEVAS